MGEIKVTARPNYQRPRPAASLPQQQKKKLAEWCRENGSLRQRRAALQRDAHQIFHTRSDLHQDASALLELEQADEAARQAEMEAVGRRLETQKAMMINIKGEIRRLSNGGPVSEGLEKTMEGLEDELYEFKCTMRKDFDLLVAKEKSLSSEVEEFRGKMREWEQRPGGDAPSACPGAPVTAKRPSSPPAAAAAAAAGETASAKRESKSAENDSTVCSSDGDGGSGSGDGANSGDRDCEGEWKESEGGDGNRRRRPKVEGYGGAVERINNLIQQEGGATGGWPQHEHDCFLRLWTQARKRGPKSGARPPPSSPADRAAVSSLLQRAQTMLPARSADEVTGHLAWYHRYEDYNEEKRRLAREWREQRQHEQRADAETVESPIAANARAAATGRMMPVGGDRKAEEAAAAAAERERERKRKEVDAWRAAKESKETELKEREEARRAAEEAKVDEERRRQRRLHERVAAYRLDREREDSRRREVERMLAREQKRMTISRADIEERAKRDLDRARERRQENASREFQRKEADEKLKAAASGRWKGVAVDRTRLLKSTKASKERALEPEDLDDLEDARASLPAHGSRIALSGRDLRFNAGRAVPTWRRGCM